MIVRTTNHYGEAVRIRSVTMASYGRPPVWEAELEQWPSIEPVRFTLWPDSQYDNVKRRACGLLARSERNSAVD